MMKNTNRLLLFVLIALTMATGLVANGQAPKRISRDSSIAPTRKIQKPEFAKPIDEPRPEAQSFLSQIEALVENRSNGFASGTTNYKYGRLFVKQSLYPNEIITLNEGTINNPLVVTCVGLKRSNQFEAKMQMICEVADYGPGDHKRLYNRIEFGTFGRGGFVIEQYILSNGETLFSTFDSNDFGPRPVNLINRNGVWTFAINDWMNFKDFDYFVGAVDVTKAVNPLNDQTPCVLGFSQDTLREAGVDISQSGLIMMRSSSAPQNAAGYFTFTEYTY